MKAIRKCVDRDEKRHAFRRDTIKAWYDYQITGLNVGGAEADTWLAKLEAGQDIEPPAECRI